MASSAEHSAELAPALVECCPFLRVLIIQLKSSHKSTPSTKLLVPSVHVLLQDPSSWLNIFQNQKILVPGLKAPSHQLEHNK
jgi:hypothetical protein